MSENELTSLPYLDDDRPESGVVVLTLADHPRRNVMSDEMTASWVQAIDALTREPGLREVVVTGQGRKRVGKGKYEAVRVDLGGPRYIKKKNPSSKIRRFNSRKY